MRPARRSCLTDEHIARAGKLFSFRSIGRWLLLPALLSGAIAAAQEVSLSGRLPAAVPDDANIVAMLVSDWGKPIGDTLASARNIDGYFDLTLPEVIDPALLEEERMGCDEQDLVRLAYLPFLLVESEGEIIGRLVLTDIPRQFWRAGMPAKHAYLAYLGESFAAEAECGGGEIDVSFEPGWNPLLVINGSGGMNLTDDPAPEEFSWHYAPL